MRLRVGIHEHNNCRSICDRTYRGTRREGLEILRRIIGVGLILASLFTGTARAAPVNVVAPWIEGTPAAGELLLAHPGVWTYHPSGISFSIRWYNGAQEGDVDWGYRLAAEDVGKKVCFEVTATDYMGSTASYVCARTYTSWPAPLNLLVPKILGEAQVGATLTADVGEWYVLGPEQPTFHIFWHVNGCQECELTEGETYTVPPGAAGQYVSMFINPSIPDGGGGTAKGYAVAEALKIPAAVEPSPVPSGGGSVLPTPPPPSVSTSPTEAQRPVLRMGEYRKGPRARAGERWSYAATIFKDSEQVFSGRVKCSAKIQRVYVKTRKKSFRQGVARCVWRIPDWSVTQLFIGRITFESEGLTATREFFIRIR
jgi:hypothetical protein